MTNQKQYITSNNGQVWQSLDSVVISRINTIGFRWKSSPHPALPLFMPLAVSVAASWTQNYNLTLCL